MGEEIEREEQLSEASKKMVDTLVGRNLPERAGAAWIVRERDRAEKSLESLPKEEKVKIAKYLVEFLPDANTDCRMWIVSALATINAQDADEKVADRIHNDQDAWVRFWATVSLGKIKPKPKDLERHLIEASKDKDPRVKAAALRLLIVHRFRNQRKHLEQLLAMAKSADWFERMTMCRAIRSDVCEKCFEEFDEEKIFQTLKDLLENERIVDIQRRAADAMGSMKHNALNAIPELSRELRFNRSDVVRRCCVGALGELKRREAKEPLFLALQDTDAEIRERAASALKIVVGADEAVKFIIKEYLGQETPTAEYERNIMNALRTIDEAKASLNLAENLQHSHPDFRKRAREALTKLGGEEAVRVLYVQRTEMLKEYSKLLETSDKDVADQFKHMMHQASIAFWLSMSMHAIIFAIGVVVLGASLFVALSGGFGEFERYVGSAGAAGSIATLLALFYKDPLKNISKSFRTLVKVDIVFSGFVRQIRQIDATFKQLFLRSNVFDLEDLKLTVEQIQGSVKKALEEIKSYLEPE